MDMVLRYFVQAGDTVLVDDPGYYALFGKIKLSRANIVGVPRGIDGPDIATLEERLKTYRPRLFFTQSVGHNPPPPTPARRRRTASCNSRRPTT